ncbi:hypothetical protein SAMN02910369_00942 [Lachnospiraceae bacterium NE2001]|nr:hypothetical protein SAMN02910369_00942 [Lachnospiraceae bacterium NE2001]
MSIYQYAKLVIFGLMFLMGLFMCIVPKLSTKKEFRDDPEQVKKVRRSGIIIMICSILIIVLTLFR